MTQVAQRKLEVSLVSSSDGFDDYDVSGVEGVCRITVGNGIKRGEVCNVYCVRSVKLGALWQGNVEATLTHFAANNESLHRLQASQRILVSAARAAVLRYQDAERDLEFGYDCTVNPEGVSHDELRRAVRVAENEMYLALSVLDENEIQAVLKETQDRDHDGSKFLSTSLDEVQRWRSSHSGVVGAINDLSREAALAVLSKASLSPVHEASYVEGHREQLRSAYFSGDLASTFVQAAILSAKEQREVVDRPALLAEQAFQRYEFGDGVDVTDVSGWEYRVPGFERTRKVYVETEREDDGPAPRWTLTFTVRFNPADGSLAEVHAIDEKGSIWGSMPDRNVRINVRQVVDTLNAPDDEGVQGVYDVAFCVDTGGLSQQKLASMALDIFHAHQGIECLEDFAIEVIDEMGKPIEEDEAHTAYSASDAGDVYKSCDQPIENRNSASNAVRDRIEPNLAAGLSAAVLPEERPF